MGKSCKNDWFKIEWQATVWPKWQIVIPKALRDKMNLKTWDNLVVVSKCDNSAILIKAENLKDFIDYVSNILKEDVWNISI